MMLPSPAVSANPLCEPLESRQLLSASPLHSHKHAPAHSTQLTAKAVAKAHAKAIQTAAKANHAALKAAQAAAKAQAKAQHAAAKAAAKHLSVHSNDPFATGNNGDTGNSTSTPTGPGNVSAGPGSATITGLVFLDLNNNGIQDLPGEAPLFGNGTVYVDSNNNGQLDAGEPQADVQPDGTYIIAGLAPGNYILRQTPPPGFAQESPSTSASQFALGPGQRAVRNFADVPQSLVFGTVFSDLNVDARQESNEPGIPSVRVFDDANGNGVFDPGEIFAFTDSRGGYSLLGLASGIHHIRADLPSNFTPTSIGANSFSVFLNAGQTIAVNFGNVQFVPLTPL